LVQENGENAEVSEQSEAVAVLLDKLGERLAFERQGTRLYEAFLQKFESLAVEGENGPTTADLRRICDEEFDHLHLLQQAIAKLGGDGTVQTPSANIAGVLSKGAVEVVTDPRTTIAQSLQAILTAELADNDGWQMLNQLAAQLGLEELEEQSSKAFAAEQEHLEKVREWLLAMTLDEAGGGGEIISEMEDAETAGNKVKYHDRGTAGASATEDANNGNALELLKQDHEKVKELFEEAESAEDDNQKRKIFKEIKKELDTHTRIEETIFYPAMLEHDELKDMVLESIEEHKQVKKLLREIGKLGKTSDKF
jgi:hypothetical protein